MNRINLLQPSHDRSLPLARLALAAASLLLLMSLAAYGANLYKIHLKHRQLAAAAAQYRLLQPADALRLKTAATSAAIARLTAELTLLTRERTSWTTLFHQLAAILPPGTALTELNGTAGQVLLKGWTTDASAFAILLNNMEHAGPSFRLRLLSAEQPAAGHPSRFELKLTWQEISHE